MAAKKCHCGIFIKSFQTYCERCAPKVGYQYCGCPGCFEITIGVPGEYCDDCKEAGCDEERCIGQSKEECLVERCEDCEDVA
jgi:hypothetical protein